MAGWWSGVTVVLLLVCLVSQSAASTRPSDVEALQGLFRAWQGTPGLFDEWSLDTDADPCGLHWKGVRCCHKNTVVLLDLSNSGVVGVIPIEIGNLLKLRYLDLSGNPLLNGAIPKEISNLHHLKTLKLSGCDLTGAPPLELGSLSNLETLDLSNNPRLLSNEENQDFHGISDSDARASSRFFSNGLRFLRHRALLQVAPPVANAPPVVNPPQTQPPPVVNPPQTQPPPVVNPPPVNTNPPVVPATPPVDPALTPATSPILPPVPAPAPIFPPAPPTPVRTYLMWVGIGAFCLVLVSVAIFCLCRKFGEQKVRGAQRLPPLPRYH